ncbi:MAG: DUF2971 domain-containing protein [Bacillota bacterium]
MALDKDGYENIAFERIQNSGQLIGYLKDSKRRLQYSDQVYHYTNVQALCNIIKNKKWHLSNPKFMNDKLEFDDGDRSVWDRLFYSSFMMEDDESIGMWSMYAQPWETGVKISFPQKAILNWVNSIDKIYEVSFGVDGSHYTSIYDSTKPYISAVAYEGNKKTKKKDSKSKDKESKSGDEISTHPYILKFGTVSNNSFEPIKRKSTNRELTGYIKDDAWSYEKEVRLKVEFDKNVRYERIAIDIQESVLKEMVITPSPLFEGDFERIMQGYGVNLKSDNVHIERSRFVDKLNIKTICSSCDIKKKYSCLNKI